MTTIAQAQLKVYSGGKVNIGSTTYTPISLLDICTSSSNVGCTRVAEATLTHYYNVGFETKPRWGIGRDYLASGQAAIGFGGGGTTTDLDIYIGRDGSGNLVFQTNSASTHNTRMTITSGGDVNLNGSSNSYQINSNKVLWNNGHSEDIFVGVGAGASTTGLYNTFIGYNSGNSNSTGTSNVATGYQALATNSGGANNNAYGYRALYVNTASSNNAFGYAALTVNSSGLANTAMGHGALTTNLTGSNCSALGYQSLLNSTADNNTGIGYRALLSTTGAGNTSLGSQAANGVTTGSYNTAVGYNAGITITTSDSNTFVGAYADANANNLHNSGAFGYGATATASRMIRIGNSKITVIQGQVGFTSSDGRFKTNVRENVIGLDFIKKLRPVTYQLKADELDNFMRSPIHYNDSTEQHQQNPGTVLLTQSGFIAQEVEQAINATGFNTNILHAPANANDPYAISYEGLVVPLVKAVQELSKTADSLKALTHKLDSSNDVLQNKVNNLTGTAGRKATANQDVINKSLQDQINNCCSKASGNNTNAGSVINTGAMLYPNVPNPFNQSTIIKCFIPDVSKTANLLILDMNGTLKKTILLNGKGEINTTINAKEFIAGMYLYTLIIDGSEIDTKKMILTE